VDDCRIVRPEMTALTILTAAVAAAFFLAARVLERRR
jgi:hypothetical protein